MRFHSEQYQFKVPFVIYADLEAILHEETELYDSPISEAPYTKPINCHIPRGFCTYSTCTYREVRNPLKLYRGKDCAEVFCRHIESEAKKRYNMFPERPMKCLIYEEWREFNGVIKCHLCCE